MRHSDPASKEEYEALKLGPSGVEMAASLLAGREGEQNTLGDQIHTDVLRRGLKTGEFIQVLQCICDTDQSKEVAAQLSTDVPYQRDDNISVIIGGTECFIETCSDLDDLWNPHHADLCILLVKNVDTGHVFFTRSTELVGTFMRRKTAQGDTICFWLMPNDVDAGQISGAARFVYQDRVPDDQEACALVSPSGAALKGAVTRDRLHGVWRQFHGGVRTNFAYQLDNVYNACGVERMVHTGLIVNTDSCAGDNGEGTCFQKAIRASVVLMTDPPDYLRHVPFPAWLTFNDASKILRTELILNKHQGRTALRVRRTRARQTFGQMCEGANEDEQRVFRLDNEKSQHTLWLGSDGAVRDGATKVAPPAQTAIVRESMGLTVLKRKRKGAMLEAANSRRVKTKTDYSDRAFRTAMAKSIEVEDVKKARALVA